MPLTIRIGSKGHFYWVKNMTFEDILKHRNVNGDIYLCDVRRWIGFDLPIDKARDFWQKVNEIKDKWLD